MNFKRPSFKRGGSTGIGQLTPRVKANMGFPNFGVSQGDNTAYQKYMEKIRANRASNKPSGLAELILGPRYTDPNFVSPFMRKDSPFFSDKTGFEFMNFGKRNNGSTTYMTNEGPKVFENIEDIKITSDADELPQMAKGPPGGGETSLGSGEAFSAVRGNNNNKGSGNTNIDKILTSELSMKDAIKGEVDILNELLGNTGISKGEKALLLAKAIKTPGTIADKLEVGADAALKYKGEQRKQDKAIILTAYKNYKATELTNGKKNDKQKQVETYVTLKRQAGDKRPQRELELEAIEVVYKPRTIEKTNPNEEIAKDQFTRQGGLETIRQLEEEISKYEGQKIKGAQEKVTAAKAALKKLIITMQLAGLESSIDAYDLRKYLQDGGRVKRAIGTPETGETDVSVIDESIVTPTGTEKIEATEVTASENVDPMKEVPVMDFSTLRNRLPQEITDDIVQLLANSKEALQDFYYLNNQQDVSQFNTKYGVNLILPPSVLA
tara:strand:- start:560 stop:2044 length:1485 start_codon:yes stop_codon:yes gene_type:complete